MSSSSSAAVRVEKATSDLLIGPDWTLNMEICDSVNSDHCRYNKAAQREKVGGTIYFFCPKSCCSSKKFRAVTDGIIRA